ncbi:MAG: 30S ribosome-binding factor RbfA [Gelidibacter sp.]|uniref:Ribosome-binding factor A n=1 Tax=Aquaticitalea lipolytica TaxID=1247562 RepID=A0A8J2TSA0_9FLAO|nr:30S ribosome-binding factor RbfA [Aquaticitalea lipolytica]MCB0447861.1 30S ribosome-binding factor RbfA [Gelidibacter sp.]GFZ89922.1 ribosome-binding factor A [Aquaticitalea lipolytica]
MEESHRQKKIGGILQQDLVEVLQGAATKGGLRGIIISVSKVNVTADLSIAKVYLSIFPNKEGAELLKGIRSNTPLIRHELAQRTKNQLRRMPNLEFFIDDSLEYIERIDKSLKGEDNPIKDANLLDKRKKS